MMNIFPLVVGAGIGYVTNWLAIKMLFKPHKEVRFMGIKVPFTPGLIPKERKRIAKSISTTINDYLLTDEVLIKELTKGKTVLSLERYLGDYLDKYFSGNYDLQELIEHINITDIDRILKKIADSLSCNIIGVIEEKEFLNQLTNIINNKNDIMVDDILEKLQSHETTDKIIGYISTKVDDKQLEEILGEEFFDGVSEVVNNNMPKIIEMIKKEIGNEQIKNNIIDLLNEVITEKIGAFGAMFINAESLYSTLVKIVEDKLDEEKTTLFLYEKLQNLVMKAKTIHLDDLLGSEKAIDFYKIFIKKAIKELENENTSIKAYMSKKIEGYIRKEIVNNNKRLKLFIEDILYHEIKKQTYNKITFSKELKIRVKDNIIELYRLFITKNAKELFKVVDLSIIIEDEINALDIDLLENMILSIARKELKAITWFGALLGFVLAVILIIFK